MLQAVNNLARAWKRTLRRYLGRRHRGGRRGAALVEMALVVSLLLLAMLGVSEFGVAYKDSLVLRQAAREGVRVAAVGASADAVTTRVQAFAPTLDPGCLTVETRYSTDDGITFAGVPGMSEGYNDIPAGSLIRVHAEYPRQLATRVVLPGWTEVTLRCDMIMQRQ